MIATLILAFLGLVLFVALWGAASMAFVKKIAAKMRKGDA